MLKIAITHQDHSSHNFAIHKESWSRDYEVKVYHGDDPSRSCILPVRLLYSILVFSRSEWYLHVESKYMMMWEPQFSFLSWWNDWRGGEVWSLVYYRQFWSVYRTVLEMEAQEQEKGEVTSEWPQQCAYSSQSSVGLGPHAQNCAHRM